MAISEIYLANAIASDIDKAYLGGALVYTRSGGSYDTDTQALLDQATTDGYTAATGTTLDALDAFIVALKAAGIWTLCDVIYLPATNGDSDFATYNLKNPATFQLTKVNSPTFTSLQGFTGNGSTSYLNTNWNLSTNGVNYTLNNASIGVYTRINTNTSGFETPIGAELNGSTPRTHIIPRDGINLSINAGNKALSNTTKTGFFKLDRTDASNISYDINGSVIETVATSSSSLFNGNLFLLATNRNGTMRSPYSGQISFAFAGADLSAKASDLYTAIQNYMTTLGTQV
jgi:hypothetical protein